MMSPRMMVPVQARDVVAGVILWLGLVVGALTGVTAGYSGPVRVAGILAGLVLIVGALGMVRPYQRPWPVAQWQAWRQRRAMALTLRRQLSLVMPPVIRSVSGLLVGEWLGARLADHLVSANQAALAGLPAIGVLLVCAVVCLDTVLGG